MGDFKVMLSIFVICLAASEVFTREDSNEEFGQYGIGVYWREWRGKIPKDALFTITKTNPIYFAQAYMPQVKDAGLQPGQLFKNSKSLTVSHEGVYNITKPVKVLCGDRQAIKWLPLNEAKSLKPETDFVPAGFQKDYETYFGKKWYNGKVVIGKVVWGKDKDKKMYFPVGKDEKNVDSFDVLCYNE